MSIVLDSRLGQIQGRLRPPDARSLPRPLSLGLHLASSPAGSARRPFELVYIFKSAAVDKDGAFQFDGLPPGRYVVNAYFDRDGIIATQPQHEVEVNPGAARALLEQIEARGGLDPITLWKTREPWLTAWALVDLKKAESLFEDGLTALEGAKEVDLWNAGCFRMVELLATPPHRREEALGRGSRGGFWGPGRAL